MPNNDDYIPDSPTNYLPWAVQARKVLTARKDALKEVGRRSDIVSLAFAG